MTPVQEKESQARIDELEKITREKDGDEVYAQAQCYLGITYRQKGDIDKAIECYLNIKHEDDASIYAQAQFYLGVTYRQKGDIDKAIECYLNIKHEDNPSIYAQAQLFLGITYQQKSDIDKAIEYYLNVKHEDNPLIYAQAQFNLGVTYGKKSDVDKEIECYLNIKHEDNPLIYAQAQFNLGVTYGKKSDVDKEIECYLNIKHEDNPLIYAQAQFNLGVTYGKKSDVDKEIECYLNIKHEDNPSIYAQAQLFLGITYQQKGDIDTAIKSYLNIKHEDNALAYAKAQLNLGIIYKQKGDIDTAIEYYLNVKYEDDPVQYTRAQLNLGIAYSLLDETDKEIESYLNIKREDSYIQYAHAQFNLGIVYLEENKQKLAEKYFNQSYHTKPDFKNFIFTKIIKSIQYKDFDKLFDYVLDIQNQLQICFDDEFERKLAHYTNVFVVNKLLDDNHGKSKASNFRLNGIYNMNDPTEGNILFKYLNTELCLDDEYGNMQYSPFISCFTLNHDNLNQFRLYGKTNQQEATGISLVFSQDFFSSSDNNLFSNIKITNKSNDSQDDKKLSDKLPIYRCIYIDPETGYIRLAQRDKMTFYREFAHDKSEHAIERLWKKYQKNIQKKEKAIKSLLGDIKEIIQDILSNVKDKQKKEALELISLILLPLQYLVKHSAFQEEQECRICDITSLNDSRITIDFDKKWLYIEYPEPIKPHIKNVYIATGAKEYYPFIVRLLGGDNSASKVQLSKNPFRVMR